MYNSEGSGSRLVGAGVLAPRAENGVRERESELF